MQIKEASWSRVLNLVRAVDGDHYITCTARATTLTMWHSKRQVLLCAIWIFDICLPVTLLSMFRVLTSGSHWTLKRQGPLYNWPVDNGSGV